MEITNINCSFNSYNDTIINILALKSYYRKVQGVKNYVLFSPFGTKFLRFDVKIMPYLEI